MFLLIPDARGGITVPDAIVFTFHNVSINSRRISYYFELFNDLHSTMFLLIQNLVSEHRTAILNLHSTMFLLIPCHIYLSLIREGLFTFHNVSINSALRPNCSAAMRDLHSTMFLLILKRDRSQTGV